VSSPIRLHYNIIADSAYCAKHFATKSIKLRANKLMTVRITRPYALLGGGALYSVFFVGLATGYTGGGYLLATARSHRASTVVEFSVCCLWFTN